jgi:hypothetical protein
MLYPAGQTSGRPVTTACAGKAYNVLVSYVCSFSLLHPRRLHTHAMLSIIHLWVILNTTASSPKFKGTQMSCRQSKRCLVDACAVLLLLLLLLR